MTTNRINRPVGIAELRTLTELAMTEEADFFIRNPHLVAPYRDRLLMVALCQGAALQYLGRGDGVKDFDVHFFYAQNPEKLRLSRSVKRITEDIGAFPNIAVDFVRTVVPGATSDARPADAAHALRKFLVRAPTPNAWHLKQKAVIGLHPMDAFGQQVWPMAERESEE